MTWFKRGDVRGLSVELARMRGAEYWPLAHLLAQQRHERTGVLLSALYEVRSASNIAVTYRLRYDAGQDDALCRCFAGATNHACWHRGVVLLKARDLR